MTNSQKDRVTLFEQRTPRQLAIDLVVMQDQRDRLAAQLTDATQQVGVMAELLRECIEDRDEADYNLGSDLLRRIDAALAGKLPEVKAPERVRKAGGSFQHTGSVVSEFKTLAGEPRIVLEFDAPVAGMLHIYRPDQVEPLGGGGA